MREYSKVFPQIWIGKTGKELKQRGIETQLLAHYLISSPHANMVGVYYLPLAYVSHETGLSIDAVQKAFENLIDLDFCTYDGEKEYVWVHTMGRFQVAEELNPRDNMVKNVNSYFRKLPKLRFLNKFYEKYKKRFCLKKEKKQETFLEGASKGLRSQEQEHEQESEHEKDQEGEESVTALGVNDLGIPLDNGEMYLISHAQIEQWKKIFTFTDVLHVLRIIQEWNIANPKKRKSKSGIVRHITLWLTREEDKAKRGGSESKSLFTYNQSIADEWIKHTSQVEKEGIH